MKNLLIIIFLFTSLTFSFAANHIFYGTVDNNWNNPNNWHTGTIPTIADEVFITTGVDAVIPNGTHAYSSKIIVNFGTNLNILSGSYLDVAKAITIADGAIFNEGKMTIKSITINGGEFYNQPNGFISFPDQIGTRIYIHSGEFINQGEIYHPYNTGAYYFIYINSSAKFTNWGSITKEKSAEEFIYNEGEFINEYSGKIRFNKQINLTGNSQHPIISNAGFFTNKGYISIRNGGTINYLLGLHLMTGSIFTNESQGFLEIRGADNNPVYLRPDCLLENYGHIRIEKSKSYGRMIRGINSSNSHFANFYGGTLSGEGSITRTNLNIVGGNFAPKGVNHNYGSIFFDSNFSGSPGTTYKCQIGGNAGSATNFGNDIIHTTQSANLSYMLLEVTLVGNFIPNAGDYYKILTAGNSVNNTFSNITLPTLPSDRMWNVVYYSDEVVLWVEPSSSPLISQNNDDVQLTEPFEKDKTSKTEISPNPFSETININVPSKRFEIFDASGTVVFQSETSSTKVNLSHLPTGFYFVKYEKDNEFFVEKIVKVK